jgi:hypothetical protein
VPRHQRLAASLLISLIVLLGAIDAWAGARSYTGGDAVNYMDMAKDVAEGHFASAINGIWSPLYPSILALFLRFVEPDVTKEFAVVRVVNFLIFLATLGAFYVFLKRFLNRFSLHAPDCEPSHTPLARWQLEIAAWAAFVWACFFLNFVSRISPDGCVAAFVFASLAVLLSLAEGNTSKVRFVGFGVLLGIGYWAKTILLPMGLVFLIAALCEPAVWRVRRRLLLSVIAMALSAAPLVAAMSFKYKKLSYGESGTLNYAWHVNQVPHWVHWQGGPSGYGTPVHSTSTIFRKPDAFAFGAPISATYAPTFDMAYWYQGVRFRFEWNRQISAIRDNVALLMTTLRVWAFLVPATILIATLCVWRYFASVTKGLREFVSLWIVGVAGVGIYLPVHFELRYVAAFLCLILLLVVGAIRISRKSRTRLLSGIVTMLCLFAALLTSGPRLMRATELLIRSRGDIRDSSWRIAEAWPGVGVKPGTPVAVIMGGRNGNYAWARLASLRIVAEIRTFNHGEKTGDGDRFWGAPPPVRDAVLQAFARNGARFVIAKQVPPWAETRGWRPLPGSDFFYRALYSAPPAVPGPTLASR